MIESNANCFSLLPPIPIREDRDGNVEALDHYLTRIAGELGLSRPSIPRMLSAAGIIHSTAFEGLEYKTAISGLGPQTCDYVAGLSAATGQTDLFRGTFLHLAPALSDVGFANCKSSKNWRKWCPQCYLEWDCAVSFEPLYWSFGAITACPTHGCELVTRCQSCGSRQGHSVGYAKRRICTGCGRSLGARAQVTELSSYDSWVNMQCVMTAKAASLTSKPISADTFDRYFARVLDRWFAGETLPGYVRGSMSYLLDRWKRGDRQLRPTFTQYLNFASFHGTSVEEILLSPESAAAEPLFLGATNSFGKARSRRPRQQAIDTIRQAMERLLASDIVHLPSAAAISDAFEVDARYLRERIPDVVGNYVAASNREGRRCTKQELRRGFCCAIAALRERDPREASYSLDELTSHVADKSRSNWESAKCASQAAIVALHGESKTIDGTL